MTKEVSVKTYVEKIDKLIANDLNPRKIDKKKYEALKKSLRDFPEMKQLREIVVDESLTILGGHQRIYALKDLGYSDVTVKQVTGLTAAQKREFVIKDNTSSGDWDTDILANQWDIAELEEWGIPPEITGGILDDVDDIEEDEPPAPDEENIESKAGELYALGRHRLLCADATNAADMATLMDGAQADMVLTDPPYNIDYEGRTKEKLKIQNDKMADKVFYDFLVDSFSRMEEVMKPGAPIYIAHGDKESVNFRNAMEASNLLLKQCLIWVKNSMTLGRQDYQWQHEPILYGWKPGAAHKWFGSFDKKTIFDDGRDISEYKQKELVAIVKEMMEVTTAIREDRPSRSTEHPTMKPVKLMARFIYNSSEKGDIILDSFGGSGSTLAACEQTGRSCYMLELDPKYCDVIRKRYWKLINDGSDVGWQDGTANI